MIISPLYAMNLEELLNKRNPTLIDVSSHGDYSVCVIKGSVNIPLNEIKKRINEIKLMKQPLLLCSISGRKSEMAQQLLTSLGIECYNAGRCKDLEIYYDNNFLK